MRDIRWQRQGEDKTKETQRRGYTFCIETSSSVAKTRIVLLFTITADAALSSQNFGERVLRRLKTGHTRMGTMKRSQSTELTRMATTPISTVDGSAEASRREIDETLFGYGAKKRNVALRSGLK